MRIRRGDRVTGAWHSDFHKIVENTRRDYSRTLGRDVTMFEVTKLWGEGKITRFRPPRLRLKRRIM